MRDRKANHSAHNVARPPPQNTVWAGRICAKNEKRPEHYLRRNSAVNMPKTDTNRRESAQHLRGEKRETTECSIGGGRTIPNTTNEPQKREQHRTIRFHEIATNTPR